MHSNTQKGALPRLKQPAYLARFCRRASLAAGTAALLLALLAPNAHAQAPTLTIHADQPGVEVSPRLYGVFFEEINHAGEGGLYAELVRNRDFKEKAVPSAPPPGWAFRVEGKANAILERPAVLPVTVEHAAAVSIRITEFRSGRVVLSNEGYWGLSVKKGASYQCSLSAKAAENFSAPLTLTLEGGAGQIYARAEIKKLEPRWSHYTARLTSSADDPAAHLVLSLTSPGALQLDFVSLFPTATFKHRPNGLRSDLAGQVNAMRPAFVRFPGGCYVEGGEKLTDAFRWPQTLGAISTRPGHENSVWGYRSTDGLGYHEYLQWCEDMGSEPLFVVNCGLAHHDSAALDQLQPWIQEALDAIEYANGPVSSKWGAVRARNGHPKPFNLRMVEIGNENGLFNDGFGGTNPQYAERYRRFYDAIKSRYPEIRTVANSRGPYPIDILDDHYYNSPGWFWASTGLYDRADRTGPKIYVGEYAVTQQCGTGNLRAALAEAAFMTGLERNSDVVMMSSYAPLFVNVNDRKWNPNAIVFDGAHSYGTPSYHVQQLFARNRPDVNLTTDVPEFRDAALGKGGIGVGTWNTQSEYKEIEITQNGKSLYVSHFAADAPGWKPLSGDWKTSGGAFRQTADGPNHLALFNTPEMNNASDYTLRLKARKLGGREGFLILFRTRDSNNYYWWNIGGWNNTEHAIEKSLGGSKMELGPHIKGRIETGKWYDIRVECQGTHIRCYLDDHLVADLQDHPVPDFAAIAGKVDKTGMIIVKVVNGADSARTVALNLTGVEALQPVGEAITLTSADMDDENSLAQPTRIVPVPSRLGGVGPSFSYTFPARSLTILRLMSR